MTLTESPEIDWTIECVCDAWIVDGEVWTIHKLDGGEVRVEGYDPECEFHKKYPGEPYDRDRWQDHMQDIDLDAEVVV